MHVLVFLGCIKSYVKVAHHRKKLQGRKLDYDCKKRKQQSGGAVPDKEIKQVGRDVYIVISTQPPPLLSCFFSQLPIFVLCFVVKIPKTVKQAQRQASNGTLEHYADRSVNE